ncbi:hypothetical protein [Nocardia ignorata]|uniref:Uncharacterized protein n=1 Tax=Nocardia ignorata TaxID=145285 RepID=A0A4V3CQ70_NOCIG|nr:hypothetical protein [Nocardia ignorata]TDP41089.1 hypothetical protein DFR75_101187 [Nocardia ignorata]
MTDIDEVEVTTELVQAAADAGALVYPDWDFVVATRVHPSQGVGTWEVAAYRGDDGAIVDLFDHREIDNRVQTNSAELLAAQGPECMGLKCSVARSGQFRIEYSYEIDEAIKWANQVFSGLPPEQLVDILRPHDL